jgi:hypothetical protein
MFPASRDHLHGLLRVMRIISAAVRGFEKQLIKNRFSVYFRQLAVKLNGHVRIQPL